jgi:hypothetical protein
VPLTNAGGGAPPLKSSSAKPKATTQSVRAQREEAINGLGQLAQAPLLATKQYADAGTIGLHWPNIAKELATLADSQSAIANIVDPLIKVGPYTGLVMAILPFFTQIAVNHGRIPAGAMGTMPGNSIAAQVEASLAEQEMVALAAQLEAEKAAQRLRDQIKQARKQMTDAQASQAATVATVE